MNVRMKRGIRAGMDVAVLAASFLTAWVLRFEAALTRDLVWQAVAILPYVVAGKYVLIAAFGGRRHSWRYIGLADVLAVVRAMLTATLLLVGVRLMAPRFIGVITSAEYGIVPFGVIAMDLVLSTLGLVTVRTVRRMQVQSREVAALSAGSGRTRRRRVLLIGAGRAGVAVARELESRPDLGLHAVGFIDDEPHIAGQTLQGLPVLGRTTEIQEIAEDTGADETIITMATATGQEIRRITRLCEEAQLPVKIVPGLQEIMGGKVDLAHIRPVAIEDLLRRAPVELDDSSIHEIVAHEVVLVTGAGGSIGSELCRQLIRFNPREIVLLERSEPALWAIHRELEQMEGVRVVPAIADVTDAERVDQLLLTHRPGVIFHAAAHKHVPMMEENPGEAIKNNVIGTKTLADLAAARDVARFVMISTDKAVNPSSVMGASKRIAERYVQHLAQATGRRFVSVRFGNVLASAGSVVPIFQDQIAGGGPVTVTHPEMHRFFMTIPEATQLVLQAGAMGNGGEIFVLDMGEPVRIVELAEDLIRLSGFAPHCDIQIQYTGLRPGEKLSEELSLSEESATRTRHPKIWIGRHSTPTWESADEALVALQHVAERGDRSAVIMALRELVPEFSPAEDATPRPGGDQVRRSR